MPPVEAVVLSWRRPNNILPIVEALERQLTRPTLTLVDSHEEEKYAIPPEVVARFDRVHRLTVNRGCYNRFICSGAYDHEYTLFVDDDLIPGPTTVDHFLQCAGLKHNRFGVLGLWGRRYEDQQYVKLNTQRSWTAFVPVDVLVRLYFMRTEFIPYIHIERQRLGIPFPIIDDDILMCHAIRQHTGFASYLTPNLPGSPDVKGESLPQNDACWKRKDAAVSRQRLVARCFGGGLKPV